jgi:flagellar hook-associated protein 2
MAGTSSIDGLVSGLDTTTLIAKLMQIESAPQALLKTKQTNTSNLVTALQSLNTKVASLGDAAKKAASATSWQALTASSSASSVTAVAGTGAQPTSITFTVDRTAAAQTSLVPAFSTVGQLTGSSGALTFVGTDGTVVSIPTAGMGSAQEVAQAITASDAGVTAVAVKLSNGEYRLQLTAKQTGADHGFTLYQGTADDVAGGTATAVGLIEVQAARDAQITLWPGVTDPVTGLSISEQVTSSSNTFADAVPGLTLTVSQTESTPVTVSTSRDDAALAKLGSDLVSQLNLVLGEITSRTASTTTTADDGGTILTPGVLGGQSVVRALQNAVSDAGSYAVAYQGGLVSPSSVGIVIDKDGTFTFDQEAFAASLAADPDKTQAVLSAVAARVSSTATTYSDPYEGLLTQNISAQQSEVKQLGDQIADWDTRLASRKAALEQRYATLEVQLSNLQAQSTWLASQLDALTASTSSSSSSK